MHTLDMARGTTFAERLKWAREHRKYAKPVDAARALNVREPTYWGWENGNREPEKETIPRLASFFRVSANWLLTGEGSATGKSLAKVVGYVGQGGEVTRVDGKTTDEDLEQVEPPLGVTEPCQAARIRGNSMYPFEDGWLVFWGEDPSGVPDDCIGKLCVVQLTDGRQLLKKLYRGSKKGVYRLDGHNAPLIDDVAVEWAACVLGFKTT
jgi:transcriptional regulator with XRE-family HTH domain